MFFAPSWARGSLPRAEFEVGLGPLPQLACQGSLTLAVAQTRGARPLPKLETGLACKSCSPLHRLAKKSRELEPLAVAVVRPVAKPKSAPAKIRNPYMFANLEARIIALEEQLASLRAKLVSPGVYRDSSKVRDLKLDVAQCEAELERANGEGANWG